MGLLRWIWAAALVLAGCGGGGEPVVGPPATVQQVIGIPADRVEIEVKSRSYAAGAPAETDFLKSPEQVARDWPGRRLRLTGGANTLRYVVDDLRVVSTPTSTGEVVTASLDVRLVFSDPVGRRMTVARAAPEARTRFNRGASAIERWQGLQLLSEELAGRLDQELTASVNREYAAVLAPSLSVPDALPVEVAPVAAVPLDEDWKSQTFLEQPPEIVDMTPDPQPVVYAPDAGPVAYTPIPEPVFSLPAIAAQPVFAEPAPAPAYQPVEPLPALAPVAAAPRAVEIAAPAPRPQVPKTKPKPSPPRAKPAPEPEAPGGGSLDLTKGAFLPGSSSFPALPQ